MQSKPKISVIVPVYNSEKYIEKCLSSIINQTIKNIEIICIDDCGTDNTMKIVEDIAKNDDRFVLLYNEKNMGQGYTIEKGRKIAKGEYIYSIDNDDYIDLNYLKEMSDILDNNKDVDLVYNQNILAVELKNDKVINIYRHWKILFKKTTIMDYNNYILSNIMPDATIKLYRKSFIENNLPEAILATRCNKICLLNSKSVYYYRQVQTSLSHTGKKTDFIKNLDYIYYIYNYYKNNNLLNKYSINLDYVFYFFKRTSNPELYFEKMKELFNTIKNDILNNKFLYKKDDMIRFKIALGSKEYYNFIKKLTAYICKKKYKKYMAVLLTIIFFLICSIVLLITKLFFKTI